MARFNEDYDGNRVCAGSAHVLDRLEKGNFVERELLNSRCLQEIR